VIPNPRDCTGLNQMGEIGKNSRIRWEKHLGLKKRACISERNNEGKGKMSKEMGGEKDALQTKGPGAALGRVPKKKQDKDAKMR